jgi:hypothetical protein
MAKVRTRTLGRQRHIPYPSAQPLRGGSRLRVPASTCDLACELFLPFSLSVFADGHTRGNGAAYTVAVDVRSEGTPGDCSRGA